MRRLAGKNTSVAAFVFKGRPEFGSGLILLENVEFRVMFGVGVSLDPLAAGVEIAELERDVEYVSVWVSDG